MSETTKFDDPFLRCDECRLQVTSRPGNHNQPCGHRAGFHSTCPSWGPVEGCRCKQTLGAVPHD